MNTEIPDIGDHEWVLMLNFVSQEGEYCSASLRMKEKVQRIAGFCSFAITNFLLFFHNNVLVLKEIKGLKAMQIKAVAATRCRSIRGATTPCVG